MFYDLNLLCPKKKGKFATVWLAATRGIKSVPADKLRQVDITHVCREIIEMVISNSGAPKSRLSLKLAAQLVFGAVSIYKQHLILFERQILNFYFFIRRPLTISEDDDDQPPKKKPRKSVSKKTKETEGENNVVVVMVQPQPEAVPPEAAVPALQEGLNPNLIDPIHITMPDYDGPVLRKEIEPFGDENMLLGLKLDLLSNLTTTWDNNAQVPDPSILQQPQDQIIDIPEKEVVGTVQYPHVTIRPHGSISPEHPQQRESVIEAMNLAAPVEQPHQEPVQAQQPAAAPQEEVQVERVEMRPPTTRKRIRAPKVITEDKIRDIIYLNFQPQNFAKLICRKSPSPKLFNRKRSLDLFPAVPDKPNARMEIIEKMFEHLECSNAEDLSRLIEDIERNQTSSVDSTAKLGLVDYHGSNASRLAREKDKSINVSEVPVPQLVDVPEEVISVVEPMLETLPPTSKEPTMPTIRKEIEPTKAGGDELSTPGAKRRRTLRMTNIEEEISPVRHIAQPTGPSDVHHPQQEIEETEQIVIPRIHTSTPIKTPITRCVELITYIRNLFHTGKTNLKIEDLCFPVNRGTISSVFGDLLYLHAKQYIVLQSQPDSLELDLILPGNKI